MDAKVVVVGGQPSVNDLRAGRPFAGVTGKELERMLHEVGFLVTECLLTTVLSKRIGGDEKYAFAKNKTEAKKLGIGPLLGKYPKPELLEALGPFNQLLENVQPNLVIALGELSCWATTGKSGITKYRGSILPGLTGFKVIPTYAPEKILRKWDWRWIAIQDLRRCAIEAESPEIRIPPYQFIIRPSLEQVVQWIQDRLVVASLGEDTLTLTADIETRCGHIECIGFADSPLQAICIPLMTATPGEDYWTMEEEIMIVQMIRELLMHPNISIVGQNFLYDAQYIAKFWGVLCNPHHDTMYEHHVAFAGLPKGLDFLSSLYCYYHRYWKDEGKSFEPGLGEEERWTYNCKDCVTTFESHVAIQQTLHAYELEPQAKMQMRLFRPVLKMMLRGVRIDTKARDAMVPELLAATADREQWLLDVAGDLPVPPKTKTASPWYASPTQLMRFLYDTLGLPQQRNRKTGRPTTDDAALQTLKKKEPSLRQFFDKIIELRSLGIFYSTFVQAPLDTDNRIRCSFNPAGTETYRFSSSKDAFGKGANLQTIPKGNEL